MFAHRTMALVVLAGLAAPAGAGEKPISAKKPLTEKECEKLVEQLVNPDKPPFTEPYVLEDELPKGSGNPLEVLREKQAKIKKAYDALSADVEVALPVLVKNVGDERFSYVYEIGWNGSFVKASVGTACYCIIETHVEVYHRHVSFCNGDAPPRSLHFICDDAGGTRKWWEKRKGRPLADLQLEALKWAIRQPQPRYFESKARWKKAVESLEKMAKEIRTSEKPISVKHEIYFFGK
jgi:hypothetical protein